MPDFLTTGGLTYISSSLIKLYLLFLLLHSFDYYILLSFILIKIYLPSQTNTSEKSDGKYIFINIKLNRI